MKSILVKRDTTIDTIRGFAIFIMIGANMIPELLKGAPPFPFRIYGSFAAPIFIFLSGMMVSFTITKGKHSLIYFCKRSFNILIVGALIDVLITGIYPFITFDVLYLIGAAMPLTFLFKKLKISFQYMIIISIFAVTPLLQNIIGYSKIPVEIPILITGKIALIPLSTILRQWIIDGWFPLFPWLGFAFLGSIAADIRLKYKSFSNNKTLFIIFTALLTGEIIWIRNPGWMFIRNGYSELFYPPTLGFILTSIGIILFLFYIIDIKNDLLIYKSFSTLGRWSIQIYVIHLIIISLLGKVIVPQSLGIFLLIYIGITILIIFLFNAMEKHS